MVIVGVGLGMSMQTLILALQNGLEFKDMGAGTSTGTFFRSMGGSFGVAVMGTVLTNGLSREIKTRLPAALAQLPPDVAKAVAQRLGGGVSIAAPAVVKTLPAPVRDAIESSLVAALNPVFIIGAAVCAVGVLFALGMPDLKLRGAPAVSALEGAAEAVDITGPPELAEEPPLKAKAGKETNDEVDNNNARAQGQTETLF
jgi:hypothetical protein